MILRKLVGSAWRVRSGHARTPTRPGRPYLVGATVGNGQATVRWAIPRNGGSPLLGFDIEATPADNSGQILGQAEPTVTELTLTGLTNGVVYTFIVRTYNAIGSTDSFVSAPFTPSDSTPPPPGVFVRPTISTVGVPGYLAADTRTPVTLTPAVNIPLAPWFERNESRTGAQKYRRFIIQGRPPNGLLERVDFTDFHVFMHDNRGSTTGPNDTTFRQCLFRVPNEIAYPPSVDFPTGQPLSNPCQIGYRANNVKFEDCTFDGWSEVCPMTPCTVALALGDQGITNISIERCLAIGCSNGYMWGNTDGYTLRSSIAADLTVTRPLTRIRGITATAVASAPGSTLSAGTYYVTVAALIKRNGAVHQFLTTLHPMFSEKVVTLANGGGIDVSWQGYGVNKPAVSGVTGPINDRMDGHTLLEYRVCISQTPAPPFPVLVPLRWTASRFKPQLDPRHYGYFTVPGDVVLPGETATARYTGQTLTAGTVASHGDWNGPSNHPDATQIVNNYAKNTRVEGNDFFGMTPESYTTSGGIQIGSMTGPLNNPPKPQPVIQNFVFNYNWIDGSTHHWGLNNRNPIAASGVEIRGNKVGRDWKITNVSSTFRNVMINSPGAIWADNVWASEGYTKFDRSGPYVFEGQLIP